MGKNYIKDYFLGKTTRTIKKKWKSFSICIEDCAEKTSNISTDLQPHNLWLISGDEGIENLFHFTNRIIRDHISLKYYDKSLLHTALIIKRRITAGNNAVDI